MTGIRNQKDICNKEIFTLPVRLSKSVNGEMATYKTHIITKQATSALIVLAIEELYAITLVLPKVRVNGSRNLDFFSLVKNQWSLGLLIRR